MRGRLLVGWFFGFSMGLCAQMEGDYRKADSVAGLYAGHALHDLKSLSDKLTQPFTSEVDKFRAIYTWTCLNIDGDYSLFLRNQYKRRKFAGDSLKLKQWNDNLSRTVFKQLRLHKQTLCTGYAYLIRELARHAGLSCVIVDGYGRNAQANIGGAGIPNHNWNAVQLNNQWYLCDATWSAGLINGSTYAFQRQYDDVYFLTNPALFARNHFPLDTAWLLLKQKPTLQQFLNGPIVYKNFLRQVHAISPDTLFLATKRGKSISFQFEMAPCPIGRDVQLRIQSNSSSIKIVPFSHQSSGVYRAECVFTSKGYYTLHILTGVEFLMSYEVRVGD